MSSNIPLNSRPIPPGSLSADTRALLLYDANKTNPVVTYILIFTIGFLGGHNFYLGRTGIAITQLILTFTLVGLLVTLVWVIVDAFLVPGIVRRQNNALASQLGA
jgi:TM2 domain-containing membrane protein YozV